MTITEDKNLEEKIKYPEGISASTFYNLEGDIDIKIQYVIRDIEYENGAIHGNLVLIIRKWDEKEEDYVAVFHHKLERKLLIDSRGLYFNNRREVRREDELKKEFVDLFSMEYKRAFDSYKKDLEDLIIVPSMLEDTMDNLFVSIKTQYEKHLPNK